MRFSYVSALTLAFVMSGTQATLSDKIHGRIEHFRNHVKDHFNNAMEKVAEKVADKADEMLDHYQDKVDSLVNEVDQYNKEH